MTLSHDDDDDINYKNAKADKSPLPTTAHNISSTLGEQNPSVRHGRYWNSLAPLPLWLCTVRPMLVQPFLNLIKDFGITYSTSSWILTTYLLTGAVMTPIAGKLSDMYGGKEEYYL